jgi:hypothetical protein
VSVGNERVSNGAIPGLTRIRISNAVLAKTPCSRRISEFGVETRPHFVSPWSLTSEKFNPAGIGDTSHNLFSGERSESAARKG